MDGLTHTKQLLNLLCIVYTKYEFESKKSLDHEKGFITPMPCCFAFFILAFMCAFSCVLVFLSFGAGIATLRSVNLAFPGHNHFFCFVQFLTA